MKHFIGKFLLTAAAMLLTFLSYSQQSNADTYFSELSSSHYKDKIATLEKYKAPKNYADKNAQEWYEEMMTNRNKSLLSSFKDDELLYDTLLLNKCNSILNRLINGNKNMGLDTVKLYISRSVSPNAYSVGEGSVMINLGLFLWIDNDDELAMVLGHEIAHQLLSHWASKLEKDIATLTSDDFKAELKKLKKAEYGKFDRFRKLMKELKVEAGKHSRYKESEADSMGIAMARNANFDVVKGARMLLKLEKSDQLFLSGNLYPLKSYIEKAPVNLSFFNVKPKYNGLSTANITMNADKDFDSIKTHPDCIKRFEAITGKTTYDSVNCCSALTTPYEKYKQRAMLEMVRYVYENGAVGFCAHLCIFALQNNYPADIYNDFLSISFSKLFFKDKNLERFNSANMNAYRNSSMKQLQDYLFDAPAADLSALSLYYLTRHTAGTTEDDAFATLMYNIQVKNEETASASSSFSRQFPNSKYLYLINPKK